MMRIDRTTSKLELSGEGEERLVVQYDNRGEPYREGIQIALTQGYSREVGVFLENREAVQLRDLLNSMYPVSR